MDKATQQKKSPKDRYKNQRAIYSYTLETHKNNKVRTAI